MVVISVITYEENSKNEPVTLKFKKLKLFSKVMVLYDGVSQSLSLSFPLLFLS